MWQEIGRTVRAALKGWPTTFRLVILMTVAAVIWITWGIYVPHR